MYHVRFEYVNPYTGELNCQICYDDDWQTSHTHMHFKLYSTHMCQTPLVCMLLKPMFTFLRIAYESSTAYQQQYRDNHKISFRFNEWNDLNSIGKMIRYLLHVSYIGTAFRYYIQVQPKIVLFLVQFREYFCACWRMFVSFLLLKQRSNSDWSIL